MIKNIILRKKKVLDLFIISNFAFLAIDILYAHSINNFEHNGEWIPLVFSVLAALLLLLTFFFIPKKKVYITFPIATLSILIGTIGIYYHFESQFFQSVSVKSLIYTAPLVAPLAYTALGLLLFLNIFIESRNVLYGQWIVILSYIGFSGNFILGLFDHAQNGFFFASEWIPVISSSLILVFIPLGFSTKFYHLFETTFKFLIGLQFVVGILGAGLHLYSILIDHTISLIDKILYGPPILAPLLFCNLALLMSIGWTCILNKDKTDLNIKLLN